MLVDEHDYHTFQPLLYQLATDLLETAVVGHPLRDLFHEQANVAVHQDAVTGIDLANREVHFAEMAPLAYDYLVLALGAEVNFFGHRGAPEHAFPMYTLADAVRLKEHVLRRWEAADKDPALVEDGGAERGRRRRRPDRRRERGRAGRALPGRLRQGLSQPAAGAGAGHPGRGRARALSMFKKDIQTYTKKALEENAASRSSSASSSSRSRRRASPSSRAPSSRRRTRSSGAPASRRTRSPTPSASSSRRATGCRSGRISRRGPPRGLRGRRHRLDHRHEDEAGPAPARLGRAPGRRARARTSPGSWRARRPSRSPTTTRGRWRRSAVERRSSSSTRADDQGQDGHARVGHRPPRAPLHRRGPGQGDGGLDLGGLHHERPGRITVRTDEKAR